LHASPGSVGNSSIISVRYDGSSNSIPNPFELEEHRACVGLAFNCGGPVGLGGAVAVEIETPEEYVAVERVDRIFRRSLREFPRGFRRGEPVTVSPGRARFCG
jgi:hypothetical protein